MKHTIQNNYEDFRDKLKIIYDKNVNITNLDFDVGRYIEEINGKLHDFKEEIMEKVNIYH
jgi:hypothetical protein